MGVHPSPTSHIPELGVTGLVGLDAVISLYYWSFFISELRVLCHRQWPERYTMYKEKAALVPKCLLFKMQIFFLFFFFSLQSKPIDGKPDEKTVGAQRRERRIYFVI